MKKIALFCIAFCFATATYAQSSDVLTVVSFNIRHSTANDGFNIWDFRKGAVIKMINTVNPDVLGVQEALYDQIQYLEQFATQYGRVGVGRDDGKEGGEFSAIYYLKERFTVVDAGNFWLSTTPNTPSKGWDAACNRMVTWVQLREKGTDKECFVFNTHFDHVGTEARKESAKLLLAQVELITHNMEIPTFITGDFNTQTCDPLFDELKEALPSAREKAPETDDRGTFHEYGIASEMIDHIFYAKSTPLSFKVLTENFGVAYISDHYPVLGRFQWK